MAQELRLAKRALAQKCTDKHDAMLRSGDVLKELQPRNLSFFERQDLQECDPGQPGRLDAAREGADRLCEKA